MYCLRCKNNTDTDDIKFTITKNNKNMKRGTCHVCGMIKTQFVKQDDVVGNGIMNSLINKLPFEAHMPGHNFTGPGTKLSKRLKKDGTPHSWSKPINRVDEAAMHHDVCYAKNKNTGVRNRVCDRNMLEKMDRIHNPTIRERAERKAVSLIIGTKRRLGMGLKKPRNGLIN